MLQLHTLGELRLTASGSDLLPGRRKELALLAYLARQSPKAVRREELIDLLWDERDEERARSSLRQALLRLRRAVGDALVVDRETVHLDIRVVALDAREFEDDARAGRDRDAVERWRGDFLLGADDVGGEAFQTWLDAERESLRRRLSSTLERLVAAATDAGDVSAIVRWAERWANLFPLEEQPALSLIDVLFRTGRSDDAIAHRSAYITRLHRELGTEPSAEFERRTRDVAPTRKPVAVRHPGSGALFTPDLVGRDAALAELTAAWHEVQSGGSATVIVEGAEGLGKTLLCERFLQSIHDCLILRARAREDANNEPWRIARDLVAQLAEAPGLGGASARALADLARLAPAVAARFSNLPEPERSDDALCAAVAEVLETVAEELPVALFVDDLPWADEATADLVVRLARQHHPGLLVLVTARFATSAKPVELCQVPRVRRLKLQPLQPAEIEALLRSMIAMPADESGALARRLHAETGGNPFYSAEIIAAMVDDGHLTLDSSGIWRTSGRVGASPLPLPSSIRDALGRRLVRLTMPARHVAGAAARLSEPCARDRLRAEVGLPPDVFETALDELISRRLLRPTPASPDVGDAFEFAHPIARRVARERLTVPPTLPSTRQTPVWRKRATLLGVAVLAVAAGTLAALSLRPKGVDVPTVAIGEISPRGDVDTLGVAKSVVDMLATNLARVPSLRVVSSVRMYELIAALHGGTEPSAWATAARRAGAGELVEGSLYRSGSVLRLDLRRVDLRTGAVNRAYSVRGADPFDLVDRATTEIAADLGLAFGNARFADATTRSLVAYRFYEEGLRSWAIADLHSAARLFDAAVAEDSTFAMARHYALKTREALYLPITSAERATLTRLAERATDRERLLIQSEWMSAKRPQFVAIAETLAARYPAEPDGHYLLGEARVGVGDFAGALPHFQRVVEMDSLGLRGMNARCRACSALRMIVDANIHIDSAAASERVAREWVRVQPRSAEAWHALARSLEVEGHWDEAITSRHTAVSIAPGWEYTAHYPAMIRFRAGDFRRADELLRQIASTGSANDRPNALWLLTISLRNQGRLAEAADVSRQLISAPGTLDLGAFQHHAQVLFELGRLRDAAALFDSVARTTTAGASDDWIMRHRTWNLTHRAAAVAALRDTAVLAVLADSIQWWGERSGYERDLRLHYHVRGLLHALRGELEPAVVSFQRAIFTPTTGYTRTNLEMARALIALGRPREAVATLQSALRGEIQASNLYVTRTDLYELLGMAWQGAGQPDSAVTNYQRVLDAWRDADASFHARRDSVRTRILRLKGDTSKPRR
jgi:DNA-binding SARP family transcriptional activator/tetratricopeptide (TPR) repeat protein